MSLYTRRQDKLSPRLTSDGVGKDLPDEVLLRRIQDGERDALATLFRRHGRSVHNIGRRILKDKAEADDLVQEVFLYLHRKSGLFDQTRGTARSWIVQVAYTQALLRRRVLKANGFYSSRIPDMQIEGRQDGKPDGADY